MKFSCCVVEGKCISCGRFGMLWRLILTFFVLDAGNINAEGYVNKEEGLSGRREGLLSGLWDFPE